MNLDKYVFAVSAIIMCASASHFLDQEWNAWKSKYGKKYVTLDKELHRRQAWETTWEKVQKHNQLAEQGLKSYRMAMNQFADMTEDERNSKSCLLPKEKFPKTVKAESYSYKQSMAIPKEVDWRKSNCVTPAKNQGGFCGSCWAFATVGVMESRYCIRTKELLNLSEQQLVDCDEKNEGCCGGFPIHALDYVAHHGVMRNKDYEYAAKRDTCEYKSDKAIHMNVSKFYILPGEENMATSVAMEGPITVGIECHLFKKYTFSLYTSGIFEGDCPESPNHAVIIVGYGTENAGDEDKEGTDYWIIKNSYGKEWGENGYIKMKRNINQCSITDMAATIDFTM
ncbi:hypothetical protein XELAEV_18018107mg [Xenopus laevis]|uniref:Uncharacterized protein n=1 Tax=Xenopus laevis TaxID=8355 RepID=A0A974DEE8_XENLA|nr:hypothetical protein XELAEV_18018107mg [Xenopus laevis]